VNPKIEKTARVALSGDGTERAEADCLLSLDGEELYDLFYWANRIRERFKGNAVVSCSIISAKQGRCGEDCKFCSQAARHNTGIAEFALMDKAKIVEAAKAAAGVGSQCFGIVTSGRAVITSHEQAMIYDAVTAVAAMGRMDCGASLGILTPEFAKRLVDCGLKRYNHNLETSERFFPNICTTHSYRERVNTVRIAMDAGLRVCCGGIFGLGESWTDRLDLAFALREFGVREVPLNFLNPIRGTPLQNAQRLKPMEILKIIALFRFILPDADLKTCGGREVNLRDLQSWMFYAGANGTMIGNYLTTTGNPPERDLQMIEDLGLKLTVNKKESVRQPLTINHQPSSRECL